MSNSIRLTKRVFAFFLLAFGMLSAQNADKDILDIRKKYNVIRQTLDSLETKDIDELRWSAEGGDAIAYHKDDQVVLIRALWFGEMGKGEYEYYFSEGNLIFAFYTDFRYNRPMYYDEETANANDDEPFDPSKTVVSEARHYFKNRVLFRWLDDGNKLVGTADYGERQKEILALSDELVERFKEKP